MSAVLDLEGEDATDGRGWPGLKANGTVYDGNNVVLEAVNSGESDAGVIYHYYWYRDQEESGENSDNTAAALLRQPGPRRVHQRLRRRRAEVRRHADDAQEFVEYLTSEEGQQALAESYALEYPLNPDGRARRRRQAARRARSRPTSTSPSSTATRSSS